MKTEMLTAIPSDLVLMPVSRRPTKLAADTVSAIERLPITVPGTAAGGAVPPTSIVVVSVDNLLFLKLCLTSVLATLPEHCQLIVVDNASRDGTAEYLRDLERSHAPQLVTITNTVNRGFGPGTNQGLAIATGELLVLLNDDTVVHPGWLEPLARAAADPAVGLAGPVTNRTGNEAQIDVTYRTYGELIDFVAERERTAAGKSFDIPVATMFCVAMRRDVYTRLGMLDERFEVGLFEDDDYSRRAREAGYRVVCSEEAFVHHFGETSFGKLVPSGDRSVLFESNRRRFEDKWRLEWTPHRRRPSEGYEQLGERVRAIACRALPRGATAVVISKGDSRLVDLDGRTAWHFPQQADGSYAGHYPADGADALRQLRDLRARGARYLVVPAPSCWWLDHYAELGACLETEASLVADDPACRVYVFDKASARANRPRCSIVIPVRDNASLTRQCVDRLLEPRCAPDAEIIVVDDASASPTRDLLAGYGEQIRVVTHAVNTGFARACNDGALAARGEYVIFLNNDTVPEAGWLAALTSCADRHERAGVVGSKLLYPDGTVQHAGIVFDHDRYPRHLYVGFPATHPAVNKSRQLQAVTAACMLVRRAAFERVNGFDTAFRNGLEDVDLCLRLGALGYEVHYCHSSVVMHLESVTHGGFRDRENTRLFRSRWSTRVQPDDLACYAEDGLIRISSGGSYPLALTVSPELAAIDEASREPDRERLLRSQSRQVAELLRETVRLSLRAMEQTFPASRQTPVETTAERPETQRVDGVRRMHDAQARLIDCERQLEAALLDFQRACSIEGPALEHRDLIRRTRALAESVLPPQSRVLVISRGDDDLVRFEGALGSHFPQNSGGAYAGYHLADSDAAIAHLEDLRQRGAGFLLIPKTSLWWMTHYSAFADHMHRRYRVVADHPDTCLIFQLADA